TNSQYYKYINIINAIKTKPFLLLAGISGTGKSRIVRELARACWYEDSTEYNAQKPKNFEMIQVKPNWHDSTELIGYVSRVSGEPIFIAGVFLKFIAKAWENIDVPHFLCLDEMNLAPVEQYFAEFLSVIESRKRNNDGNIIITDPIIKPEFEINKDDGTKKVKVWYSKLVTELLAECSPEKVFALTKQFEEYGISIPQNLIVVGTVNMDETTFSFSRKVLDRAMTIEMNKVDLYAGLDSKYERIGKLNSDMLIGTAVEGVDVYADNEEVCNKALTYLQAVNDILDGTPFKIAYRTRNEFLLYVVNNLPYNMDENGNEFSENEVIATALDEITSMKILSRIEGDDTKVRHSFLEKLIATIETQLLALTGEDKKIESVSIAKLKEMQGRLSSGYTSFWS
ncbi:AAA domain-containing protein, partial [Bacteroides salyersiae]